MKAVYAALSLMLAASLAWADIDRGVRIYDRCEVERMDFRAQDFGRERCSDGIQFDFDRDWAGYQCEASDPSLCNDYYMPQFDPGILRPARYVPGSPDRDDNSALPNMEPGAPKRHNEIQTQLESGPVPASVDPGWPPPEEAVSLTAENNHFWPPSVQVLPPLEFDGGQPNPEAEQPPAIVW